MLPMKSNFYRANLADVSFYFCKSFVQHCLVREVLVKSFLGGRLIFIFIYGRCCYLYMLAIYFFFFFCGFLPSFMKIVFVLTLMVEFPLFLLQKKDLIQIELRKRKTKVLVFFPTRKV